MSSSNKFLTEEIDRRFKVLAASIANAIIMHRCDDGGCKHL